MNRRNGFRRFAGSLALGLCIVFPRGVDADDDASDYLKPWHCTLCLLDPEGKPVAGGKVIAYQETKGWMPGMEISDIFAPVNPNECVSDKNGLVTIRYPEAPAKALHIEVHAAGFVPLRYIFGDGEWLTGGLEIDEIPREFDVRLSPGMPAGGVVRGSNGKPLEGAVVVVRMPGVDCDTDDTPAPEDDAPFILKTDRDGKWTCRFPPPDGDSCEPSPDEQTAEEVSDLFEDLQRSRGTVAVMVDHPEYAPKQVVCLDTPLFRLFQKHKQRLNVPDGVQFVEGTAADVVLGDGVNLSGCVVDESGKPLADARVSIYVDNDAMPQPQIATARSTEDGRFVVRHLLRKPAGLCVLSDGYAPCIHPIEIGSNKEPLRLEMKKGGRIKLRVRDSSGRVVLARVSASAEDDSTMFSLTLPPKTDAEGNWTWNSAPLTPCSYEISAHGFEKVFRKLPPGEHIITLKRPGRVHGRVIDAETGKPIKRFFVSRKKVVVDYFPSPGGDWRTLFVADSAEGTFSCICAQEPEFHVTRSMAVDMGDGLTAVEVPPNRYVGSIFRIEAEGYMPVKSKTLPWKEDAIEVTFEMRKARPLTGRIVDSEGRPVAGAEVVVVGEDLPLVQLDTSKQCGAWAADWRSQKAFQSRDSDRDSFSFSFAGDVYEPDEVIPKQPRHTRSDEEGLFMLFPQKEPYALVVIHFDGCVFVPSERFKPGSDIVLKDWARIEGVVRTGGKPDANLGIEVTGSVAPDVCPTGLWWNGEKTTTDEKGRFTVARVPPGEIEIGRQEPGDFGDWTSLAEAILAPGETREFFIAPTRRVHGTVVLPEKLRKRVDFAKSFAVLLAPGERYSRSAATEPNGAFRIADVPSGLEFELMFILRTKDDPSERIVAEPVEDARKRFTVPAAEEGSPTEPFDLKKVAIEAVSP